MGNSLFLLDRHSDDGISLFLRQLDQPRVVKLRPGIRAQNKSTAVDEEEDRQFRCRCRALGNGNIQVQTVEIRLRNVLLGEGMLDGTLFEVAPDCDRRRSWPEFSLDNEISLTHTLRTILPGC